MNAYTSLAQNAYAPASASFQTPREIERRALARVTAKLRDARDRADEPGGPALMAQALSDNVRLWSILAADCAAEGNALPPALRGNIISFAAFAVAQMQRVFNREADVDPLIDINIAIMRGLGGDARPDPGAAS